LLLIQWRDRPEPFLRPELLRAAYEKIFQDVIVLRRGQWFLAHPALHNQVSDTRLRPHPDNLVTRLTTRAGEVVATISLHFRTIHRFHKAAVQVTN